MLDFFNGWRRKAGTVLLVLACVLTGGWTRSSFFTDEIDLGCSKRMDVQIGSRQGILFLIISDVLGSPFAVRSRQHGSSGPNGLDWWEGDYYSCDRDIQWCGFRFAKVTGTQEPPEEFDFWAIPYWSIVLPLTLLSAYLLLWKPRPKPKAQPDA